MNGTTLQISLLETKKRVKLSAYWKWLQSLIFATEYACKLKQKELHEWEKETADLKKLDKEQHETFKTALARLGSKGTRLTRKDSLLLLRK